MIMRDEIIIGAGQVMPSLGTLIGSRVSSEVFDAVNNQGFRSFFGSDFDAMNQEFYNRHVQTMDLVGFEISRTVNMLMNPDKFRILNSFDDFRSIPPCMEMAICLFPPVRQAMLDGKMEGFGYDPLTLDDDDVYGRLLDNFTCEDVAAASDSDGYYPLTATMLSDDPDLSDDDLYCVRRTREFILDRILKDTNRDPTAIDVIRG